MRFPSFVIFFFILNSGLAQINDTPNLFSWKGKKTVSQKGYVVLKSDKKLDGFITLKGAVSNITGLHYSGDGKEIDFPMSALKSFGVIVAENSNALGSVNIGAAVCDHNEELFVWGGEQVVMDKVVQSTKTRKGYIIKRDGSRVEGDLQLKKSEGEIVLAKIKTPSGKQKIPFNQVSNYGLLLTIAELTKSGDKKYKDEARNFYEGEVSLLNGEIKKGLIAFKKKTYINPNKPSLGYKYQGVYFAENKDAIIKTFKYVEVKSIKHQELSYSPYKGGFVAENAMDNAKYRNKLKLFNKGTLTLFDGTKLVGEVALVNQKSARYKSSAGVINLYDSEKVKRFDVIVEGKAKAITNIDNKLTEEFYRGTTFLAYDNPSPTTINQKKTNSARSLVSLSTSFTSAIVISNDAKKQGYETNLDSIVMNSSAEKLKKYRATLVALNGYKTSEELQDKSTNETAKKYDAVLGLAIAGKEAREKIVVYFDEIILKNLKTQETVLLYKDKKDLNAKLEGLLMGCYTFLSLDKKAQNKYYNIDNITETTKMLDECY